MNEITESPLAKKILEKIGGERPRPRWEFLAKEWFFWAVGAVAVALGALAVAAALFEVANAGWGFYAETHENFVTFFLAAAPFLWLLVFALFIVLGYENIRRTRRGYRYPFFFIIATAVLMSAISGAALYTTGFGQEVEEAIGDHAPFYRPIVKEEQSWWEQPGQGLLGGTVEAVGSTSDTFVVKDFKGNTWQVDADNLGATSSAAVERGGEVRIVGVPAPGATSTFEACAVYPWQIAGAAKETPVSAPFSHLAKGPGPVIALKMSAAFAPAASSSDETSAGAMRIEGCKGIRPYRE